MIMTDWGRKTTRKTVTIMATPLSALRASDLWGDCGGGRAGGPRECPGRCGALVSWGGRR
jgi:hypothetical protein